MAIAIVSEKIRAQEKLALEKEGFSVLLCPASPLLPTPIAHHPDAILALLGGTLYCYEGYYRENAAFFSRLSPFCKIRCLSWPPSARYPEDCAYNLLQIGNHAFYNPKGLAPLLASACEENGRISHHVHQGYAACTVRALGDRHAITADAGMERALTLANIQTLRIREGGISLPPYTTGFIGGASGCYGNTIYLFGSLSTHPDGKAIEAFAKAAGFRIRSLSKETLCDLGGILFIEQCAEQNTDGRNEKQAAKTE